MTDAPGPPLVRATRAAAAAGVSRVTLWGWVQAGIVAPTAVTAGGHNLFDPVDVVDQLADPPRRVAAVVVVAERGLLVIQRDVDGLLELPTARHVRGERMLDTAARAAREAAGVEVVAGPEVARSVAPPPGVTTIYRRCTATDDADAADDVEGGERRWVSRVQAADVLPRLPRPVLEILRSVEGNSSPSGA